MTRTETVTPQTLARRIDHTLLTPEATTAQIDRLCDDARRWNFATVCVNPVYAARAAENLANTDTAVCTVAGFPLGADPTSTKVYQAARAIDNGATEIDMVIHIGALIDGQTDAVIRDIEAVANTVHKQPNTLLKVILETAILTPDQIRTACRATLDANADFVKTSTGLHKAGGATIEAVKLLAQYAQPLKVKAAGGIRSLDNALAMIQAGAHRLGTSASVAIMNEFTARQ